MRKELSKQDLILALEETYKLDEHMINDNLEKMAHLNEQIEAIKEWNFKTQQRMKEALKKLKELKGE